MSHSNDKNETNGNKYLKKKKKKSTKYICRWMLFAIANAIAVGHITVCEFRVGLFCALRFALFSFSISLIWN